MTPRLMKEFPVHLRAYDLLDDGDNDPAIAVYTGQGSE